MSDIIKKISGVGLDTRGLTYCPTVDLEDGCYDYIHTSISENNDYVISDLAKQYYGLPLVTTIDFSDSMDYTVSGHLITLERDSIDLLLIDSNCNFNRDLIKSMKANKLIIDFGVSNPSSVERLQEIQKELGDEKIEYISLNLCPFNFNYDIVNWCESNDVKIMGFNPFGGHISANSMIDSFTVPYLLGFSATYCTVVFVSGRDMFTANLDRKHLDNLIKQEVEPRYILKKNISKLYKPIKKVVETSIVIGEDTIPYDSPDTIFNIDDIVFSLGKSVEKISEVDISSKESLGNKIKNIVDLTQVPADIDSKSLYALYRYRVLEYLKTLFPEDEWKFTYMRITDNLMAISVKKDAGSWLKKKEITNTFVLGLVGKYKNEVYFREVI